MSNSGKFNDRTPFLKVAGISTCEFGASADQSIRQDFYYKVQYHKIYKFLKSKTSTPEKNKKYRKSKREELGIKQLHHGVYDDPKDYEKFTHGIITPSSDHVNDCIFGTNLNGIKYFMNEMNEKKYSRIQKEPLGKPIVRNYIFPDIVKDNKFKFGCETLRTHNAKELIYAPNQSETEENKKLYNKTHGFFEPGEQKNRNYNWRELDKTNHIFGKFNPREYNGAKKSLNTDFLETNFPKTKLVDKRLEDYRSSTADMIGKGRFRGTLNPQIDENFAFGVSSIKGDNKWNMGKCLQGDHSKTNGKFLEQDKDLGKTILHSSKLSARQPREYDPNRTFGIPSIRHDLPKKRAPSVSDLINYGTEKDVFELLYPNPHSVKDLDNPDFENLNSSEEVNIALLKIILD